MFLRKKPKLPFGSDRFQAAFEGIEGGFAVGASVMAGLSFADLSREVLVTTAFITLLVNGFNSASVRYSSAHYMDELDGKETRYPFRDYFIPSLVQFLAYAVIGLVSLLPVLLMTNLHEAVFYSCIITLIILLIAGYWRAKLLSMPKWRDGLELSMLGLGIILVGFLSGWVVHVLLG